VAQQIFAPIHLPGPHHSRPSVEHQIEEENRVVKDEEGVGGE
jgi:hypothetical protein